MKVYFATSDAYPELTSDDQILKKACEKKGHSIEPLIWSQNNLKDKNPILIRSTWDYYKKPEEFRQWLNELESKKVPVLNPVETLRWNMDKRYLLDLERLGLPIVPSLFYDPDSKWADIKRTCVAKNWKKIVIKPVISAGAHLTQVLNIDDEASATSLLSQIFNSCAAVVQPFIDDVSTNGEASVLLVRSQGRMSFLQAISKQPKTNDFRVQEQFGGQYKALQLNNLSFSWAYQIMDRIPTPWFFARLDLMNWNKDPLISEVELIEPDMYFRLSESSANLFAHILNQELTQIH